MGRLTLTALAELCRLDFSQCKPDTSIDVGKCTMPVTSQIYRLEISKATVCRLHFIACLLDLRLTDAACAAVPAAVVE